MFNILVLFSLARMSLDQRICPVFGGSKCRAFMSPLFRDPHPTCARCRGRKCTSDMTCDIRKDWSVAQWEAFVKKRSYNGRRKSRPSGSSFPTAPLPLPPSASASSEAGHPFLLLHLPPFLQKGGVGQGSRRVSPALALALSLLLPLTVWWEKRGGDPMRVAVSGGECDSTASALPRVGVAGP